MAGSSTVYDVRVKYGLEDKVSGGARSMAGAMDRAGGSAMTLRGAVAGLGLAGIFVAGKKALIDFNSEMDQMKIGMTTILTMQLKKPWEEAKKSAEGLFSRFQELSKKSPATTKDFIAMANALTPMIASMGGGVDKIEKITQGTVLAGLATGTRSDVAALDVKQMLAGTVTSRDMMANQLLGAGGIKKEDFNAMSAAARGAMVERLLSDPALLKAAEEFGQSFAGQVSTFQDQLQMALGTVGKPLMADLTKEVQRWNTWIEKHPKTIARISKELGGMIKDSFSFIAKTVGWLVEHRETIMSIGKIFLVFKGAQLATNTMAGLAQGIKSFSSTITAGAQSVGAGLNGAGGIFGSFKSLTSVVSGVGGAIPALAGLAMAASTLWGIFTEETNNGKKNKEARMTFAEAVGDVGTMALRREELLKQFKSRPSATSVYGTSPADNMGVDERRRLETELNTLTAKLKDPELMGSYLREIGKAQAKTGTGSDLSALSQKEIYSYGSGATSGDQFDLLYANNKDAKALMAELQAAHKIFGQMDQFEKFSAFQHAFPDQFDIPKTDALATAAVSQWKDPNAGKPTDVKVTIQKIEVASDDPDRFVFGMVNAFKKIASNPTQALSTLGD